MNTKSILGAVAVLVVALVAGFVYWKSTEGTVVPIVASITSFEECAKLYRVMESYPAQCATPDGKHFVQDIGNELAKKDLITIDSPRPTATISSPLTIEGSARGTWYFEASFPVELQDNAGNILIQAPAQAQGEWMTTEFVPYKVTILFPAQPKGSMGKLILRKDNPSGLPEHEDALIVPIVF